MKFDKLAEALCLARDKFGLDCTDVLVLDEVLTLMKSGKEATIMEIVDKTKVASPATVHARIKSLCNAEMLTKTEHAEDMRVKVLGTNHRFDKFIKALAEV